MKKVIVRIIAALLVAMLALTLIPMGAFAHEDQNGVYVQKEYYETKNPSLHDYQNPSGSIDTGFNTYGSPNFYEFGSTIKVKDYNNPLIVGGSMYDFAGFDDNNLISEYWEKAPIDKEAREKYLKETNLPFINANISVPKDLTSEENKEWYQTWSWIYATYTPHHHSLSRWYSDSTTHWRECLVCKNYAQFDEDFMFQNWHSDGDEDRICDVCKAEIPYHTITVIDSEGGKITVNETEAPYRRKITAEVEVEDGYVLKKLHFTKVRDDGSRQEVVRNEKGGSFWTTMPTYDLEVSAEFIKK